MAFNYAASQATAQRLIKNFGQTVPIRRFSKTFDPIESTGSDLTKSSDSLVAVSLPFSSNNAERLSEKLLEDLRLGRVRKLLCSNKNPAGEALKYTPEPLDVVTLDSDTFRILAVTTLSPGGVAVIHTLIAEKCAISSDEAAAVEEGEEAGGWSVLTNNWSTYTNPWSSYT